VFSNRFGNCYCLTIIDRFTRWPEAIPIKNITANTVITGFYTHWISRFGAPVIITTDRGSQFESQIFIALTNLIGFKKIRTTTSLPFHWQHPAANGMVERWHRSLKASIMCHGNNEWVDVLPTVLLGLRTSFK